MVPRKIKGFRRDKMGGRRRNTKLPMDIYSHTYFCIKKQSGGLGRGCQVLQDGKDTPGNLVLTFTARPKPDNGTCIELSDGISASLSYHLFILAENPYSPKMKEDTPAPSENIRHTWGFEQI